MSVVPVAQSLIQCASETADNNGDCSTLLKKMLEARGFEVHWYDYRDLRGRDKVTLAACRRGAQSKTGIAFFSHSDVVSSEGWRTAHGSGPWDALVHDGRLWGRGACDMKGPISSLLSALQSFDSARQAGNVYVFITGDEECGMVGAELLTKECPLYSEVVATRAVGIITEPTRLQVVSQHKGGCRFRVTSHGTAAHSSTSDGLNANWQLIPWLDYLRSVQQRIDSDSELRNEAFDPPTLSPNLVLYNQPSEFNITVSQAQCELFLRIMPDTAWQALVDELTTTAREMELEVSALSIVPPLSTSADSPLVIESLRIVDQQAPKAVSYATDGCRYKQISDLIVLGPGNIEQAHRCDEWIEIEQLEAGADIYARLLQQFAG